MNNVWAVFRREITSFFDTVVGPVVVGISLVLFGLGVFYFGTHGGRDLIDRGVADLYPLFFWTPLILALTSPGVTMRLMAEERGAGTYELVRALPISAPQLVAGKFLAGLAVLLIAIAGTLPTAATVALLGPLEIGPALAGYLGMVLMACTLVSAGLLISSLTSSQTVAFFVTELVAILWWAAGRYAPHAPLELARVLEFVSIDTRFRSIARGVVDTRDVAALLAMTGLCLAAAVFVIRWERLRR